MSEKYLKMGQRVEVQGKSVRGKIAFIGMTSFQSGKWVGVILDEPKGKNNGTIKGSTYFKCEENHGMFVRPAQLIYLDENDAIIDEEKPRSRLSSSGSIRTVPTARPTTVRRKSPVKVPQSYKKPTTLETSMSTSSSRTSLAGSRHSLAGSRTQLVSPNDRVSTAPSGMTTSQEKKMTVEEKRRATISPPTASSDTSSSSKRASFVETNFIETLKPQFTPIQSIAPSPSPAPSVDDKLKNLQTQQENDDLKNQVRDLTEKLDTLKQRRAEDKERIREFEKMKTQFEQLQEFKSRIMDSQSSLQRELQRAKQDAKDAIEARDRHAEEMSELAESVELITLDKEMAEEKSDTLQIELDGAKERIEELRIELEVLQTELQNKLSTGGSAGDGGLSTYEFKQLEQQNIRLRETLVRMRDLTAHEKHELQKLNKELEMKKSEVAELQRTKEKLSMKVDELEAQVVDLKEQVDAALGAEEMVEQLAEKKMELEDKVKQLEEEVTELEALEEVHEQLVESNHELELDLREELDMALSAKREMTREKDAAIETILDREQTINKFRELVGRLNDQMQELRERANQESSKNVRDNIVDTIDFKKMFAESKAYTRAIDLQLRQIDLTQSREHVKLLTAYMPETFMARGSDNDAMLMLLLVARILFKTGIISTQAKERFTSVENIDRNTILQGHVVQQFAFRSRLLYHVSNLQAIINQFIYALNICKPEVLLKTGSSLPEMMAQEKVIDGIIELLKSNQLDENSSIDGLEKCGAYFNAMYSVLLVGEDLMNETQLVRDYTASILSACESISTDASLVQSLIKGGDETSESALLLQYCIANTESIKQQLKLIKRRLPTDTNVVKCCLSQKTIANLKQISDQFGKALNSLFITAKLVLNNVSALADGDSAVITQQQLTEFLSNACDKVYEQEDRGPSQNLRTVLTNSNMELAQLAQYLLDHELEIMAQNKENKNAAPITLRAQFIKKQLEETKTLTATLENREAEIRQLKLAAKMKQEELSEMQVRKNLAEKKLSVLQQDYDQNTEKLQKKYEETMELLQKKEKEYEETMDHLQNDIDSLESERGALREKLKNYSNKKGDLKSSTAFDITASSPYIAQELTLLKKAFLDEREERIRLQASEFKKVLNKLEPIHVPQPKDNRTKELELELMRVKKDWILSMVKNSAFPTTNTKHANMQRLVSDHRSQQRLNQLEIKLRAENIASEIMNEYLVKNPYRSAKGDFTQFPTVELSKTLRSS